MRKSIPDNNWDVAIIGAGPAGLAAGVYLARFLLSVVIFDAGDARARLIPKTHNCPGFPDGISGPDLLKRLRGQAASHGIEIISASVEYLERTIGGGFTITTTAGVTQASHIVLATGIVDCAPAIPDLESAIAAGRIRLCPVCDAYEAASQRIGVIGPERAAIKEALFLKEYSAHVCMLFNYPEDVSDVTRIDAAAAGIEIWDFVEDLTACEEGFDVIMANGSPTRHVDTVYPCMGCEVRSELAFNIGADCDEEGYILVSSHLETSVTGLYAIGDVAKALNQIAVGFGHAAVAAAHINTTVRKKARARRRLVK